MNLHKMMAMLYTQDKLQTKIVGDKWWQKPHPQHLAIFMESAELVEHVGYKWWKHHEPNVPAAQMELVDIWHFCLNIFLASAHDFLDGFDYTEEERALNFDSTLIGIAEQIQEMWNLETEKGTVHDYATTLAIDAVTSYKVNLSCLRGLSTELDLNFDRLYTMYMAKNALNVFRSDHGYRNGDYVKHWPYKVTETNLRYCDDVSVEDNTVVEYLINVEGYNDIDQLTRRLEKLYSKIL